MNKEVLLKNQMEYLKSLGIDTSRASMKFISVHPSTFYSGRGEEIEFIPASTRFNAKLYNEDGPTFTLQDVLGLMPKQLKIKVEGYSNPQEWFLMIDAGNDYVYYEYFVQGQYDRAKYFYGANLLESAYKMLCWLIDNGYLTTKNHE